MESQSMKSVMDETLDLLVKQKGTEKRLEEIQAKLKVDPPLSSEEATPLLDESLNLMMEHRETSKRLNEIKGILENQQKTLEDGR